MVRGVVVPGAKRGRQLGFPTANLATESEGLIPADGVYAAWATVDGERMPAAVSVGNNPTFDGVPERQVEAHLLGNDFGELDIDLYGKTMELDFIDRIRGMEKFESVDELVTRIGQDVERVRELLSAEPA
jgi:FAD synthase